MNDKITRDWLSGKTANSEDIERKDYYSVEMEYRKKELDDLTAATEEWVNSPDDAEPPRYHDVIRMTSTLSLLTDETSPYNRAYVEPIDLDLIAQCLCQMNETNQPLPYIVTSAIIRDIDMIRSRREGELFVRTKGRALTHPEEERRQRDVVELAGLAEAWEFEENAQKMLEVEFGIPSSTYYSWRDKYHDQAHIEILADDRDQARSKIRRLFDKLAKHYYTPE